MKKNYHHVEGKLLAQPGQEGRRCCKSCWRQLRNGGGGRLQGFCYLVGTRAEEPGAVYVIEVWKDAAAHQASLALPVFQALIIGRPSCRHGGWPSLVIHGGS